MKTNLTISARIINVSYEYPLNLTSPELYYFVKG